MKNENEEKNMNYENTHLKQMLYLMIIKFK